MDTTWDEAILKRPSEPKKEGSEKAFAFGLIGSKPQFTVIFQQRDGNGAAFAYAHLYRIVYTGKGTLEIEFSEHVVRVEGRNLGKLLRYLCDHKVSQVWESDERAEFSDEKTEAIEAITIGKRADMK